MDGRVVKWIQTYQLVADDTNLILGKR